MAVLNLDIGDSNVVVNQSNVSNNDTLNITAISSGTLTVDGVSVTVGQVVASVGALATPTFAVVNGGQLTIDQGLLGVQALQSTTFEVGDTGTITLNAAGIDVGLLTGALNTFNVNYTGARATGNFIFKPTLLSVAGGLAPVSFNVTGMGPTDTFTVVGRNISLDTTSSDPKSAYRNGILYLEYDPGLLGGLLMQGVRVQVPMTQAQADEFFANRNQYLVGNKFTFPTIAAPCFAAGSLIETIGGLCPVEQLKVGDLVKTRDNGYQEIQWIGSKSLSADDLVSVPNLRPIRIKAGALGENMPLIDLMVSPQHRILVRSKIVQRVLNISEVLVLAKQLLDVEGIEIAQSLTEVTYFHLLFERHEIIFSNGAETESFYIGPEALEAMTAEMLEEVSTLFPDLVAFRGPLPPARPFLTGQNARKIIARHLTNGKNIVAQYLH